jgi:hypothetical protein
MPPARDGVVTNDRIQLSGHRSPTDTSWAFRYDSLHVGNWPQRRGLTDLLKHRHQFVHLRLGEYASRPRGLMSLRLDRFIGNSPDVNGDGYLAISKWTSSRTFIHRAME